MDVQQVERFFTRLKEDRALSEEYRSALNGAIETAVAATIQAVGERHGFPFSADAARTYLQRQAAALTDQQLDAVVGGLGSASRSAGSSSSSSASGSAGSSSSGGWGWSSWTLIGLGVAAAIAIPRAIANDDDDAS
jgi:hypothetical protein